MKKKRKRGVRRGKQRLAKKRTLVAAGLILALCIGACCYWYADRDQLPDEIRGVWLSYVDFEPLGLYNQTEEKFREHAETFFQQAEENSINTVYFHVRAFRDAAYKSDRFPMSKYIWDKDEEIDYDPLEIMAKLARKHHMRLHAWLNPYRNTSSEEPILDPASQASTEEIVSCIREILSTYHVAGIHFDDYFYMGGSPESTETKKRYVNEMIRSVYKAVKECGEEFQFGVSPAGDIAYCETIGADVKTWLSEEGYVDYIIPQIYWTDSSGEEWRENRFTNTLEQWVKINKAKIPLYVGLALYRAGETSSDDKGWSRSSSNLAKQISQMREKQCGGFALFSARHLSRKQARQELENCRKEIQKERI